jgi:hypothetical protein
MYSIQIQMSEASNTLNAHIFYPFIDRVDFNQCWNEI